MLRAIPLFNSLSDEDIKLVNEITVEKHIAKNTVVISEREIGDSLYAIVAGRVKVFIGDEEGREIILKILGPGDFFGEMSLIDKQPRSASVATLDNSVFKVLSHGAFEMALDRAPRIAISVMQALAKRLRDADRKISTLALMDVYGRVAHTLLELAALTGGPEQRVRLDPVPVALGHGVGASDQTGYIDSEVKAFGADYTTLLAGIRARAGNPRIVALNVPNLAGLPLLAGVTLPQQQAAQRASVGMTTTVVNALTAQGIVVIDLMCDARTYIASNYSSDGFHPNDAGYAFIAGEVVKAITSSSYPAPLNSCSWMTLVP